MLLILDGWGYRRPVTPDNAIENGHTPNWHRIVKDYPTCFVETSGLAVGLPEEEHRAHPLANHRLHRLNDAIHRPAELPRHRGDLLLQSLSRHHEHRPAPTRRPRDLQVEQRTDAGRPPHPPQPQIRIRIHDAYYTPLPAPPQPSQTCPRDKGSGNCRSPNRSHRAHWEGGVVDNFGSAAEPGRISR